MIGKHPMGEMMAHKSTIVRIFEPVLSKLTPDHRHRFDDSYHEETTLADGSSIVLKTIKPDDKQNLQDGVRRLSPESRFRRFFSSKSELTSRELAYFTEIDGENHFALACGHRHADGTLEGLAVARFVRRKDCPEAAEPAIAVVDDWQGKGVGRLLLTRLASAALERGITRFEAEVLADNEPMIGLLSTFPKTRVRWLGEIAHAVVHLTPKSLKQKRQSWVRP